MEFLYDEDVMTEDLKQKASELAELKEQTAQANSDINDLKFELHSLRAKRLVVESGLNHDIQKQRTILRDRLRRKRQLTTELAKLKVGIQKCCQIILSILKVS